MANGISPFDIAKLSKQAQQNRMKVKNWTVKDAFSKKKFMGETTEKVEDEMFDIDKAVADLLGSRASGQGALQGLSSAAMFMHPLAAGITSGLSALGLGSKKRKHALKMIDDAMAEVGSLDTKYQKSWMGRRVKDWTRQHELGFEKMKKNLPSKSDVFMDALTQGIGSYIMGGGKKEMANVKAAKAANQKVGPFTGGLDLWGDGLQFAHGGVDYTLGKPIGNLLQDFLSGDESVYANMTKRDKFLLARIAQIFKLGDD